MNDERKLPPTDLHSIGYNIPYLLRFNCYHCGEENESKESFTHDELFSYKTNKNRLMTLMCKKCKKTVQFRGYDVLIGSGYQL